MKTSELREKYLTFFEEKGCVRRPSDVLVPRDDPTVLFTPAGMNQFKNQFLGVGPLEFSRATTCQKCLRTGDISNVGVTAYHHTFFEMLGNFSFGDYFKREAIHWAWEFLTQSKWLGLDADRLTVTVYKDDDEAYNIWHEEIGLATSRIRRDDEHENFWPAGAPTDGPDGVCGPCSEIFYHPPTGGKEVEIWNLVFTQFERVGSPPDNLRPLPQNNIDTGMGLERTAAVLQGVESNFEIDILRPLCEAAGQTIGLQYAFDAPHGRPLRRIADHIRAVTFCIHEGVAPGSETESYIVRQLLRRALLDGWLLGRREPVLHLLVPAVGEAMKSAYPEIVETVESVTSSVEAEEDQFFDVVERGLTRFNQSVERARSAGSSTISGHDAFTLHTQEGFLIELTEALAARHNLSVDRTEYNRLLDKHVDDSGRGGFTDAVMAEGPLDALRKTSGGTTFLGYEQTEATCEVVGIIAERQLVESLVEVGHELPVGVVLNQTPFYGEAGGQVGDCGLLTSADGCRFRVLDTQRDGELLLHLGHLEQGELKLGMSLTATVESDRRGGIRRAHSATHLLHHALRSVLGSGATQRGSKVEDDVLRFDFAHRQALEPDELRAVEDEINLRIAEGAAVTTELMDLQAAREAGAMALFGEKYPDRVRVVRMGDFSTELCGGTHLANTGQVGVCRIVSEDAVARGVRRITAVTGRKAIERIRAAEDLLRQLSTLMKTPQPEDLPRRIEQLQSELRDTRKELAKFTRESAAGQVEELLNNAEEVAGTRIVTCIPEGGTRESMRDLVDELRNRKQPVAILLGCEVDGKVALIAAVSRELVAQGVKASDCIRVAAREVGGGGGGRPDMAEAGGRDPAGLPAAMQAARDFYRQQLES